MKTAEIRTQFLQYFNDRAHDIVDSSPLVPPNDPTLLFTNAGMVQFKEIFLGHERSKLTRAVSSQCCLRAGGKHNDLDNVGYTARHHTFFEMLGNFSFGDYFKREAIQFAWEFLTEVLKLPKEKLWVTVYTDDDEAADIWLNEIKVDPSRFTRCGEKDNFWSMGETGPCGPCTEVFYDHGEAVAGGPPGTPEADGDRYVEIWNLVFMQYNRDDVGQLHPLPAPSVDTGMGLERIAAVMQGVHSNYDIDLFQHLIQAIAKLTKTADLSNNSLKVIADHIRAVSFLILEGVIPSNEGRGYVLRRILRRAIRHGHKLGVNEPFFYQLASVLAQIMGDAYPQLKSSQDILEKVILKEEEQFAKTLDHGLKILEQDIRQISDKVIPGEIVFKLYDTYGFPIDLTADIAREKDLTIDIAGFERCMSEQRAKSQAASHFVGDYGEIKHLSGETTFTGYDLSTQQSTIKEILFNDESSAEIKAGQKAILILDETPFYAESGGQVGDIGRIISENGTFVVTDTQKQDKTILHIGEVKDGSLQKGNTVKAEVDEQNRNAIRLNHTATHLLHAALRDVLGEHVIQKGSLVESRRLRFDFTHFEPTTAEQLQQIEDLVNQEIRHNHEVATDIKTPDDAKAEGAMALFGEKYDEKVRVLTIGQFSKELCGGTHVKRTGDIGLFKITTETGIAAGIRRIEAVTGLGAMNWVNQLQSQLQAVAGALKTEPKQALNKVQQLLESNRSLNKTVDQLQSKLATSSGTDLSQQAQDIKGVKVIATKLPGVKPQSLRETMDQLKNKLGSGVIVLASVNDDKINVVAGVTKDCIGKVPSAKDLVVSICGKGGGREDMAQGGSPLPEDLDARLSNIMNMVEESL